MEDILNFISKLTFRKIINTIIVQAGYFLSVILKKPFVWGYPDTVSIEPASICMLKCPECPTGMGLVNRKETLISTDLFHKIVDELSQTLLHLIFYFQGEPLLHNDFFTMVKYAEKENIYVTTSTNGQLLTPDNVNKILSSGLDRLIVSIDGTTQEVYEKYRKQGTLDKVINGTRRLIQKRNEIRKNKPKVLLQFLVFKHNEHQIDRVRKMTKDLGVDGVLIKTAQIYDLDAAEQWLPEDNKYSRYFTDHSGKIVVKNKLLNRCKRLWRTAVITTDGVVVPCCFDKLTRYPMGSLYDYSFKVIWEKREYNHFRERLLNNRNSIDICRNCTEGLKWKLY